MHNACCDVVVPLLQMKKAVDFGVKSLKGNLCVLAATNHQMYNHNRAMKLKSKRHLIVYMVDYCYIIRAHEVSLS